MDFATSTHDEGTEMTNLWWNSQKINKACAVQLQGNEHTSGENGIFYVSPYV